MPLNVSDAQVNRGWVTLGLKRKELTNVSQILTRSGRNMKLSYVKDIFCRLCTMHEHKRQADNGNVCRNGWNHLSATSPKNYTYKSRQYNKLTQTHFKRFVENAEAPGALSATSDDLDAELVFCVGSEVIDVNIQVRRVCHFLPPAGRAAAARAATQLVPHRI